MATTQTTNEEMNLYEPSDSWPNAAEKSEADSWNKDSRKPEHRAADFTNGGRWCVYDEVDLQPGKKHNAGEANYGKKSLAKQDAIEAAKELCLEKGHIGFVLIGKWSKIFF